MPVALTWLEPHRVSRMRLSDGLAGLLHPCDAAENVERLAVRMGVPRGSCAGLEGNPHHPNARGVGRSADFIEQYGPGEVLVWSALGNVSCGARDVHDERA